MKYTTLQQIKQHDPCESGWEKLRRNLGKGWGMNKRLSFKRILKSNGLDDALWALRVKPYKDVCLFAADVVEQIALPVWRKHGKGNAVQDVIKTIRLWEKGKASSDQLNAARAAAWDAARAAARAAAGAAARAAARAAAGAAAWAAAWAAAGAAAGAAAWDAARAAIERLYKIHFCGEQP